MSGPKPTKAATAVPTSSDVAVVICAYTDERWEDMVESVDSALSQSRVGEVALVIDHNDRLLERSKERFGDSVILVANKHKKGLSGARNTGIDATSKPIIAFLDDDATARPDWLLHLVAPYSDDNVMGVGGVIEPEWQTARPAWWPTEFDWVVGCTYTGMPLRRTVIRNPIGANMSVRRAALVEVGGFSSEVGRVGKHPVGGEETELFIRIARRVENAVAIYEPAAGVDHKVGAARARVSYFLRRCYAEGLSKAIISQLDKEGETLTSEWSYTLKTLPLGVLRGLRDTLKGNPAGVKRSAMIIAGLGVTTVGYARGRMHKGPERNLTEVPHSSEAA